MKSNYIISRMYMMLIVVMGIIAYIDTYQINAFFKINTQEAWGLYNQYVLPSFIWLWLLILAFGAIVYYLVVKDKSESIGIFAAGAILLFTGIEDILYFVFSGESMSGPMCWFNDLNAPVAWFSEHFFNEACVSQQSLVGFAILGVFASYLVLKYMVEKL